MINIISRSVVSTNTSGPKKVVDNLIKGLDIIGYPYVINKSLDACERLWIHDDLDALRAAAALPPTIKKIAGPNIYILPRNIPEDIDLSSFVYIQPSPWAMNFWKHFRYNRSVLDVWPTGVDTNEYRPDSTKKDGALIYFKQRSSSELSTVTSLLIRKKIPYTILTYGSYTETEYKNALHKSKYCIWLGCAETQGLALQEALSTNLPIVVWDVLSFGQRQHAKKLTNFFTSEENSYRDVTAAPYFSATCGLRITSESELEQSIDTMGKTWQTFSPRQYVVQQLSLEKQARDFIALFGKHYGLSFETGLQETPHNNSSWKNARTSFILETRMKDFVKKILKKTRK